MKMRFTALLIGVALSATVHAQNVSTVLSSNLFEPNSITTDANNVAYMTDGANNRVVKYDSSTASMTSLAGYAGVAGTNNGIGISARFFQPAGIVYTRGGLVVADSANHLLRYVTLSGIVSNLAGVWSDYGALVDGPANTAQFSYPLGLSADKAGNIYIADSGNGAVRMLDTNNVVSTIKTGLYQPSAVLVTTNGDLWVADTRHHVIQLIQTNGTMSVIAGALNSTGTNDALVATDARFNMPSGLYMISTASGLLISDTGNNTIRRLYYNTQVSSYSVETVAGQAGRPGLVDGLPMQAKFNAPIGICADILDSGFFVVDRANNALRRLQTTAPQPPVSDPVVGFVTFTNNGTSQFAPAVSAVFNNSVIIAIKAEPGVQTFITYGPTPANSFEDTIPLPNAQTGVSPTIYKGDNLPPELTAPSIVPTMPDITIKSICMADGRRPSNVTTNRYQFKTGNPSINGDNAAAFQFDDITTNCAIWYTIDGSDPTNSAPSLGPVVAGQKISLAITNDTLVKARAFLDTFTPSESVSKLMSVTNFNANKISFGFAAGEASSAYIAAAGQTFFAPVTLSLLDGQQIYSMQFNITVTNLDVAPPVAPGAFAFESMLCKPNLTNKNELLHIPPAMFITTNSDGSPIFSNMEFTVTSENLLGLGWFERIGETNLYDTKTQDLITYSMAHNSEFLSSGKKVIVGGYSFNVPSNSVNGNVYQIQLGRPSGTEDGIAEPVFIQAPTNGTLGAGSINSIKNITVGSIPYLVGDAVPFRWFNAGDFGDNVLNNADIMDLFQAVVYSLNGPPPGSDFFDAMDSSDHTVTTLDGDDTQINNIQFGDQKLGVDDIYVTFRRSLDPNLLWYARYWSNGVRQAMVVPNAVPGGGGGGSIGASGSQSPKFVTGPRFVNVAPDDVQATGGATVTIPVRASIAGNLPIKVMALNIDVMPLDGSPAVSIPITFNPASGLGSPTLSMAEGAGNYAGCWLSTAVTGVSGTNVLGTLSVTLPTNAVASSAWLVHFSHLTVSPNGVGLFPLTIEDSLITTTDRSGSSWGDGIPDSWRLRWFGSVSNLLSGAGLDPDGDGHSNYAEFKAGTNPLDNVSCLNMKGGNALSWPSIFGKQYSVECSSTLFGGSWSCIGTNLNGTGQMMQFSDPNPASTMRFYRVKVQ